MYVVMDVFSGRPNPEWRLTETQSAELLNLLLKTFDVKGAPATYEGLGYRGFIVKGDGDLINGYDEIRIYRNAVIARRGNREETFIDAERSLERWLLDSAKNHVDKLVLQHIQDEIAR